MSATVQSISPLLADRFIGAFAAFVQTVTAAITDGARDRRLAAAPAFHAWKSKVLPLLQRQYVAAETAAEAFRRGDPAPILASAAGKRGLAKDLDGFSLAFAGPVHAASLDMQETALIMAAYQLCAAAGIP